MKNLIFLLLILLALSACAVNKYTGSITVVNSSAKDAVNISAGNVYIGYVAKGQTTTVYFFTCQINAVVSIPGFSPSDSSVINLSLDNQYLITLSGDCYSISCTSLGYGN